MMSRRGREPSSGRHPPPLAPTFTAFHPRSEWNRIGVSMFLYVNLPGFFRDQIVIGSDKKTRTFRIHGKRQLSRQTWASFDETYRVPDFCDMDRMRDSFSRGLLSIEMPIVDAISKQDKRPDQDERTATTTATATATVTGDSLERKKTEKEEKFVEEKKGGEVGRASQKAKEVEESRKPPASGSLEGKKPEKVVDEKKVIDRKLKEQEDRKPTAADGDQKPVRDIRSELGKNITKPEEQGGRSGQGTGKSGVEELGGSSPAGEEERRKSGGGGGEGAMAKKEEEPAEKERKSLVNVGVAALVIMGFGAYLSLPLLKAFY